ncbi:MAG: YibE/F family protein, partial [bacterium]
RVQLGQVRRDTTLLVLFCALTLGLILTAGWEGFIGLFCSTVTVAAVLYAFFPLILTESLILLAGFSICLLTIVLTMVLVLRGSGPVVPAVGSLTIVTCLSFLLADWGMRYLHLDPQTARHSRLILTHLHRTPSVTASSLGSLLVVGICISTLGAIMDVAVVVSSTVHEIMRDQPDQTLLDGFWSGLRVGREILSTMINTLFFAYLGILLPVLLALHVYELPWLRFLNYSLVGLEILRLNVGLLGLSVIIPTTAYLSSWWFSR